MRLLERKTMMSFSERRIDLKRYLSAIVLCGVLLGSSSAFALGTFGVRLGTGLSFYDGDLSPEPEMAPFAIGASWLLDLSVVELEIDALTGATQPLLTLRVRLISRPITSQRRRLPAYLWIDPKVVQHPVGGGLEPRFLLSADPTEAEDNLKSTVMYMPISMIGKLNLAVITIGVEVRYEYQLTDRAENSSDKFNQLVFMGGIDFNHDGVRRTSEGGHSISSWRRQGRRHGVSSISGFKNLTQLHRQAHISSDL